MMGYPQQGLRFIDLTRANKARCDASFPGEHLKNWTLNDWLVAVGGELGEAMNIAKKLKRGYDLTRGQTHQQLKDQLADELADVVCYLDLCATSQGINLGEAVASKFNRVSARVNSPERICEDAEYP